MGRIEISIDFEDFQTMKIGRKIIQDLNTAIDIVRASKIRNVQLQWIKPDGSTEEWDNL